MEKKEQIYQAAIRLFNHNGFENTPTSQIAKEAGVATGTLFHYFKTKDSLINSLFLKCKETLISIILSDIHEGMTYRSKMKQIYFNSLNWGLKYTEEFLFLKYFSNTNYINEITKIEARSIFSGLMNLLKEGMNQEIIRKAPDQFIFTVATSFFMSSIEYFIKNNQMIHDEAFVEEAFSFIWNSIKM